MSGFDKDNILQLLSNVFNSNLKEILIKISDDYNLDSDTLINKYVGDIQDINLVLDDKRKKRKKNKILASDELCMAKKADNLQCTRRRKEGCEYCGKHQNNLKFGRIDDEERYNDKTKYIRTIHKRIDGEDYLIDDDNIVYTFDKTSPEVLGVFKEGKIITESEINKI